MICGAPPRAAACGPVDNRPFVHRSRPQRKRARPSRVSRPSSPSSTLPMYYDKRFFKHDGNRHRGRIGDEGHLSHRDELVAEARARLARAVSTRATVQVLAGILLRARQAAAASSPRPTWSSRCARRSTAQVEGDGAVVVPGRLLVDLSRLLPDDRGHDRASPGGRRRARHVAAPASSRLHTFAAEDFPRLPDGRPRALHASTAPRCSRRSSASSRVRLPRRVAAGADRHPRALRGRQARHGRDRLVPARREGDRARAGAVPELEAIIPARALGELGAARGAGEHDRARRAREPRHLRRRRRVADDPPHRRPVPELQAAPARVVRARARRCRATSCSTSSAASA